MRLRHVVLPLTCAAALGCGSGSAPEQPNTAPLAAAGADQVVPAGQVVTLDATGSLDAEGDALAYAWTLLAAPTGSAATLAGAATAHPTFTADLEGTYLVQLVVSDQRAESAPDTVVVTATFAAPAGFVAVNFTVDDRANRTYDGTDGLAWKGSFAFDPASRVLTFDGSWPGPFAPLYDDGPWTSGGHEPDGAVAGDHLWGLTAWVAPADQTFEYGVIRGSVGGSDGEWIWAGPNGSFAVAAGTPGPIAAAGLLIPPFGTTDLRLTLDARAGGAALALPFQGSAPSSVAVRSAAWGWNDLPLVDDGTHGDEQGGDGIFTFVRSLRRDKHEGLLLPGELPFLLVLDGVEYRVGGVAASAGLEASLDAGGGWAPVAISTQGADPFADVLVVP